MNPDYLKIPYNQQSVKTFGRPGSDGIVPWINFGAIGEQLAGKDADVFPGVSFPGGVRGGSKPAVKGAATTQRKLPTENEGQSGPWTGTGSGGGGGAAQPVYDPADLAYLDDQQARLERQKQSAKKALDNGLTQLSDSYNREKTSANRQRSRALEDFGLRREDTTRAKDRALNVSDSTARQLANSLRQKIGLASGSNSSAYQITAPEAVAREAGEDRAGIQENYGVNFRNLRQAEDRAKVDFESLLQDLEAQRRTRESDFRSGILDRQNQIDSSLAEIARQRALVRGGGYDQVRSAMAPYSSAIDNRQADIDNLFSRYRTPFNVQKVNVQAPQLRDYVVDRSEISADQVRQADPTQQYRRPIEEEEQELPLY